MKSVLTVKSTSSTELSDITLCLYERNLLNAINYKIKVIGEQTVKRLTLTVIPYRYLFTHNDRYVLWYYCIIVVHKWIESRERQSGYTTLQTSCTNTVPTTVAPVNTRYHHYSIYQLLFFLYRLSVVM